MHYHQPTTIDEAVQLLARIDGARCVAGGQTLVAMLNARLLEPEALISLSRIAPLSEISILGNGTLRLGAMATHAKVAASPPVLSGFPMLAQTAAAIAHPAVRNFGTIGGAVAHGDPAADYPAALVAGDAVVEIASTAGSRRLPVADFFQDYLTTALEPGEMIVAIEVPRPPAGTVGTYYKYSRVDGDYATIAIAAELALDGTICRHLSIAVGSAGPVPVRARAVEVGMVGKTLTDAAIAILGNALAEASDPVDDVRGSTDYRRAMIAPLMRRVVDKLRRQAAGAA